jgi:parvulin-like peptidyl-prolyl isomerase
MHVKQLIACGVCASALLLTACAKNDTAALVNGNKILKSTYEGTLQNMAAPYVKQDPAFLEKGQNKHVLGAMALQELITQEVLAQEAVKQNLSVDDKVIAQQVENLKHLFAVDENGKPTDDKAVMERNFQEKLKQDNITQKQLEKNIRRELLSKTLLNDMAAKQKIELQEETLQKFYNGVVAALNNDKTAWAAFPKEDQALILPFAAQAQKVSAERAKVSAIFLATPKGTPEKDVTAKKNKAKDIVKELKAKKITFVDAIQKYSDDKAALQTGGEQLVLKGTLPEKLDKQVFSATLGEVKDPIVQDDGIYIIRVNEKRAQTIPAYAQLKNDIVKYLAAIKSKAQLQQSVQNLVAQAKVEILLPEFAKAENEQPQEEK